MSLEPRKEEAPADTPEPRSVTELKEKSVRFPTFNTYQRQLVGGLNKLGVVDTSKQEVTALIDGFKVVWEYEASGEKRAAKYGATVQRIRVGKARVYKGFGEVEHVPASVHRQIDNKIENAKRHDLQEIKEEQKAAERGAETAHQVAKAVSEEATTWSKAIARAKSAPDIESKSEPSDEPTKKPTPESKGEDD